MLHRVYSMKQILSLSLAVSQSVLSTPKKTLVRKKKCQQKSHKNLQFVQCVSKKIPSHLKKNIFHISRGGQEDCRAVDS